MVWWIEISWQAGFLWCDGLIFLWHIVYAGIPPYGTMTDFCHLFLPWFIVRTIFIYSQSTACPIILHALKSFKFIVSQWTWHLPPAQPPLISQPHRSMPAGLDTCDVWYVPSTLPCPSGHDAHAKETLGNCKGILPHTHIRRKLVLVPTPTVGLPMGYEQGGWMWGWKKCWHNTQDHVHCTITSVPSHNAPAKQGGCVISMILPSQLQSSGTSPHLCNSGLGSLH